MDTNLALALFNFGILIFGLRYLLKEPLHGFLSGRSEAIQEEMEAVSKLRCEVEEKFQTYQSKLRHLSQETEEICKAMEKEGKEEREIILKKAQDYSEKIKGDTSRVAEQELRRTKELLQEKTLRRALDVAKKIILERVTPEDHERLVTRFVEDLTNEGIRVS